MGVFRLLSSQEGRAAASGLLLGTSGLGAGLVIALLLFPALSRLPGPTGTWAPLLVSLLLGALGAGLALAKLGEILEAIPGLRLAGRERPTGGGMVLLDTSSIIDGRVADLVQTGFVRETLGIPQFILDELRHVADSGDALRRNRGRRGLEVLNELRKESKVPVRVLEGDVRDGADVDSRLISLAKQLKIPILTTDFNLNRVATFQGVRVLNINELANALRPVVLSGEEIAVRLVQEGKESGQGVGFLDDGTMVVVDGGSRFVNREIDVVVTRVLPTVAGRIIFAVPKGYS